MNIIIKAYHLFIKRDIVSRLYTNNFKSFGNGSVLYTPQCIRNKDNIYVGNNTTILNGVRIQIYNNLTGLDSKVIIGNNCYIGYNNTFLAGANIELEDGVLMASNILISSENHATNPENANYYMDQKLICSPVHIGEGTWIGERAIILPGVIIGKKCVIGAGSVVTKSIPDYCMVVGSPARVIKQYNFTSHTWEKILRFEEG